MTQLRPQLAHRLIPLVHSLLILAGKTWLEESESNMTIEDIATAPLRTNTKSLVEFLGASYSPPENEGQFKVLDPDRISTLRAWVDQLIPGNGHWPPASSSGVLEHIDAVIGKVAPLRAGILDAIVALETAADQNEAEAFVDLAHPQQREALQRLSESPDHGPAFSSIFTLTYEAYYRNPRVMEVIEARTGFRAWPSLKGIELPPFDESRLERVKQLPKRYLEV